MIMIVVISQSKLLQTCWVVDMAYKLQKRYSSISQILWSGDFLFGPIVAR